MSEADYQPPAVPDWFRSPGKHSGWRTNVAKGLHPLGRELRANGKGRCGSCKFRVGGRCDLFPPDVHGAYIRVAWKACVAYVPSSNPRVFNKAERDERAAATKAGEPDPYGATPE